MTRLEVLQDNLQKNEAALQDLRGKRDASGAYTSDAQAQIRKLNEDFEAIKSEMEIELISEKRAAAYAAQEFAEAESRSKKNTTTTSTAVTYDDVFWRYMKRNGREKFSDDEMRMLETRGTSTQITTTDSLGGYLVPQEFSNQLENMMKWYGGMLGACQTYSTARGGTLEWPTGDDTAVTGNINTAANQAATRTVSDLTFGQVLFGDWLIDSNIIKVSRSLIQDESVGLLQNVLRDNLANRLGRKVNSVLTTGTGTNQPYGLTTTVTGTGITTAGATAITKSELVRLIASVDYAYANPSNPKVGFMMHQGILAYLRTLDFSTDTTHIFVPGNLATGEPDRLLGYPIFVNNDLTGPTNGLPVSATKHIYFGDFSKYVIRRIREISIERNDQQYWDALQVGFMGWLRIDGNLINANAIKPLLQT